MSYAFPPAPQMSLPIVGQDTEFPVRRIYCVGKNYTDHVIEMGGDITRSEPVFFTKDASTIVKTGTEIPFPPNTSNLHYEVELLVAMGPNGIFGYGVGIDMTRRDIQAAAKDKRQPWDRAKSFTHAAPCSAITKEEDVDLSGANIRLTRNGKIMQHSAINKMIWSVDEIIQRLSADMDLQAGDLIFTGTPEGVGPVDVGETLIGTVDGLAEIRVTYV